MSEMYLLKLKNQIFFKCLGTGARFPHFGGLWPKQEIPHNLSFS